MIMVVALVLITNGGKDIDTRLRFTTKQECEVAATSIKSIPKYGIEALCIDRVLP